jgi:hypothetical protein
MAAAEQLYTLLCVVCSAEASMDTYLHRLMTLAAAVV